MIVYTGGTFDILHYGHIRFLKRCREIAGPKGQLVVSLNTDEFIYAFKKKLPIMSYAERKASLEELEVVSKVIKNVGGVDSKPAILSVKPDMVAIGSDWARKDYYAQMQFDQDWLDKHEIMLCYIPYTKLISTTEIKKRVGNHNAQP